MTGECEPKTEHTLDVRWLLNPRRQPMRNLRLTFAGSTLVDLRELPAGVEPEPIAVVPPFVNPHAHLEFTDCTQPVDTGTTFPDWIRGVISERQSSTRTNGRGVLQGLAESAAAGVAVVGDIVTSDPVHGIPDDGPPAVVGFREFIGLNPDNIDEAIRIARTHLTIGSRPDNASCCTAGLSPHAPYSVHPDLCAALCEQAAEYGAPAATHLAESPAEMELVNSGTGPFREFLRELGLWNPSLFPAPTVLARSISLLATARRGLVIHGNFLGPAELRQVAESTQLSLVYCPRTHHYFGHPQHPWRQVLEAGGRVVLGTDGKVSNPDLSIWRELQFIARKALDMSAAELLPMITTDAADAVGRNPDAFELRAGTQSPGVVLDCRASSAQTAEELLRDPTVQPAGWTTDLVD